MKSDTASERKIQLILFIAMFVLFLACRATQVIDSNFNMLQSHAIYTNFNIDVKPYLDNETYRDSVEAQIKLNVIRRENPDTSDEWWRLLYPPMPSILALPFVYILDHVGFPVANKEIPIWNEQNEYRQQRFIAALLMALYTVLLYRIARNWLSQNQSLLICMILVLGGSILSTLSRAAWSDTWATLFVICAISHLVYVHRKKSELKPILLSVLLGLAVLCKPIYAISAIAVVISASLLNIRKTIIICLIGTTLAIAYGFWAYNIYGNVIGHYRFEHFSTFHIEWLLGQFISPSRGMLIFWTWIIAVVLMLPFSWHRLHKDDKAIVIGCLFPPIVVVGIISFFPHWGGGFAYGPRLDIPALPWLSLISIIIFSSYLQEYRHQLSINPRAPAKFRIINLVSVFVVCISLIINFYGAVQRKTFYAWHVITLQHDSRHNNENFERFWNWRDPVFLAGIIKPERYYNYKISFNNTSAYYLTSQLKTKQDILELMMQHKRKEQ